MISFWETLFQGGYHLTNSTWVFRLLLGPSSLVLSDESLNKTPVVEAVSILCSSKTVTTIDGKNAPVDR